MNKIKSISIIIACTICIICIILSVGINRHINYMIYNINTYYKASEINNKLEYKYIMALDNYNNDIKKFPLNIFNNFHKDKIMYKKDN